MTIPEMHADVTAKLSAWNEAGAAYENEFDERMNTAEAVIRGELKPQDAAREAARVAYLAAVDRLNAAGKVAAATDRYPGRPDCPAVVDPSEIPL